MPRRSYYEEEIDRAETDRDAEELDRALIAHPNGLADFAPRPAWGSDPSQLAWPPTLPIELAMHVSSPKNLCETYGISREEWDLIRANPMFTDDLKRAVEMVREDGGSFKARSRLQALEYLKEAWRLVHDPAVPAVVRADLIKSTVKWSGLDASKDQGQGKAGGTGFMIQINLG